MQEAPLWAWVTFGIITGVLLIVDLFLHSSGQEESRKASIIWSVVWIAVGLVFAVFVWKVFDPQTAQEYLAAYLIEKSLSLDNLFVFLIIFSSLNIPEKHQRTGLRWGIFGALVFRAIFIFIGTRALERWQFVEYVFAAILFYAAFHALREKPQEERESKVVAWLSNRFRVSTETNTSKFIIQQNSKKMATPLLIAVLAIEATDIVFAIDSVPAALSVSRQEFVVYSSNAFAILGLRALYMVLSGSIRRLQYLHYGLAAVLAFAGVKMVAHAWVEIPPLLSVAVIVVLIGVPVLISVRRSGESVRGPDQGA